MTQPNGVSSQRFDMANGCDMSKIFGYVFAPVTREEVKYLCLIICAFLGTSLAYFAPEIIPNAFLLLIGLLLCLFWATVIWLYTILPFYKRIQFVERVKDVFRRGINNYLSSNNTVGGNKSNNDEVDNDQDRRDDKNLVKHKF